MKTWLITGCSSGFGRSLATAAAERGDQVVATARNPKVLDGMAAAYGGRMITLPLDVTDAASAASAVAKTVATFGALDILVNNAGHGLYGAIEEVAPDEYRPMFEVNVFGLIETTKAALPVLRERGGTIVNFSSGAGIAGSGGSGYYNATKFAVEGLSEALAEELQPFGIRVVIVEPGPFRTEFLGRSITLAARVMPEYATSAGRRRRYREANNGVQAGDPDKAVAVILQVIDAEEPPLHLPLGPVAYEIVERKLAAFKKDVDGWRDIAIHTDFDAA
jgi:NAD(P)-dependent dehydrogenase (short-subunit alcohol dehydrogenase family)